MSTVIDDIDYGPLHPLIGTWRGQKGVDTSPEPNGTDKHAYFDEMTFSPSGAAENAEEQQLVCVRYHQVVRKKNNGKIFHDQIGHWIYEPSTGLVMHSLSIPRAVCVLAGGSLQQQDGNTVFSVKATADSNTFGVVQSPFMLEKAKTTAFTMTLTVSENELHYSETTFLDIYGRQFDHTDESTLSRVIYD